MTKEFVEVRIDMETGEAEVEAFNYTDGRCRSATETIEKALGKVTDRKVKNQDCGPAKVKVGK